MPCNTKILELSLQTNLEIVHEQPPNPVYLGNVSTGWNEHSNYLLRENGKLKCVPPAHWRQAKLLGRRTRYSYNIMMLTQYQPKRRERLKVKAYISLARVQRVLTCIVCVLPLLVTPYAKTVPVIQTKVDQCIIWARTGWFVGLLLWWLAQLTRTFMK